LDISEYYNEISQCNKCGFCQVECPIFRSTGHEAGVARGRLALLRAIIEGRLEWTKELEGPLFNCLLCNACTANCFPAIPTAEFVVKARSEYLEKVGRKSVHRLLFHHLLPYPRRLHWAARTVASGKNTGISDLAGAIGLLRIFGRDFSKASGIVERIPAWAFREKFKIGSYEGKGNDLKIGYFVGCGVDTINQDSGKAALRLLKKIGRTVTILDNCCCGLPAMSYGDLEAARKMAGKNLEILTAEKFDVIVTDCSSCGSFLKKYPEIFPEDSEKHELAQQVSSRIRDMVELIFTEDLAFISSGESISVTYHDPCHASRGQGLTIEPREILKRLPGVEYIELPEAGWCCGGAGSYAFTNYDLSREVLDRKMENIKKTDADIIATSCPACIIHLSYGVREHGLKTKVCHIAELTDLKA